jgi:hypothetical protein
MNFIHAVKTLPRLADDALGARLRVMPVGALTKPHGRLPRPRCAGRALGEERAATRRLAPLHFWSVAP